MNPGLRRRFSLTVGVVMVICCATGFTGILALSITTDDRHAAGAVADQIVAIGNVRLEMADLAAAGERVVVTGQGTAVLADARAALEQARARVRGSGASTTANLDRHADDYATAVIAAATSTSTDSLGSFVSFRDAIRPVREAFESDVIATIANLDDQRAAYRDRADTTARRAGWAVGVCAVLSASLIFGLGVMVVRDLRRQARRFRSAADAASRATASRQELLDASEDLRRPIATILRSAATLRRTADEPADQITRAAEQLGRLVDELLDASGVEAGTVSLKRERCDSGSLLETAVTSVQVLAVERVVDVVIDAPVSVLLNVDRRRMLQVLGALIGAGVRIARPGGSVRVSARPVDGEVRFTICSSGPDSLPAHVSRVFDKQPGRASDTANLGIHIARRLIEAHGGRFGSTALVHDDGIWFCLPTEPQLLKDPSSLGPVRSVRSV